MSSDFPARSPLRWLYIEPPLRVACTSAELALPAETTRIVPAYVDRSIPAEGRDPL